MGAICCPEVFEDHVNFNVIEVYVRGVRLRIRRQRRTCKVKTSNILKQNKKKVPSNRK